MAERTRILLVEDDRTLARGLVMNLECEGFEVLHAAEGERGLQLALDESPALIILDLMLPGLDGFEVVTRLRERAKETPVLVLSARGEVSDKVKALGHGADGYLTKPFSLKELLARIHAGLRRPLWRGAQEPVVRFGNVVVHLEGKIVHRGDEVVSLTSRELALLLFLVAHPGRIYSRDQLVEALWSYDYEGTARTVDNFVRHLRVKLEPDADHPRHFVNVRGLGYRFDP